MTERQKHWYVSGNYMYNTQSQTTARDISQKTVCIHLTVHCFFLAASPAMRFSRRRLRASGLAFVSMT